MVGAPDEFMLGRVYVYTRTARRWPATPSVTLVDPNPTLGDTFGYSVALFGDTLIVGDFQFNHTEGIAYVYVRSSAGWPTEPTLTVTDPRGTAGDGYGVSVAVTSDTALISAYAPDQPLPGQAYLYARTSRRWSATPTMTFTNPGPIRNLYGLAVALAPGVAVVGACGCGGPAYPGFAYIYSRGAGGWNSEPGATLLDPGGRVGDFFGGTVGATRGSVVVGAAGAFPRGAAYVFERSTVGWPSSPTQVILDPGQSPEHGFGGREVISGHRALITASQRAYVFTERGRSWNPRPRFVAIAPGRFLDGFGRAVSIAGRFLVVSAPGASNSEGQVYIFDTRS